MVKDCRMMAPLRPGMCFGARVHVWEGFMAVVRNSFRALRKLAFPSLCRCRTKVSSSVLDKIESTTPVYGDGRGLDVSEAKEGM